ncbi:MAG: hypothetical protein KKF48_04070 [Nanoarchaeota archaeon]|nr:hypothetical protein [Nanoarchaeota archaeon]MBU1028195.1 hypothetical protein [Nanoarchaeota archaeon]
MINKRGQGLSTNAIILIILGVVILVVLIIGFTLGWERLAPWIKPSNNVKDIVQACSIACSTENVYDYCSFKRELKAEDLPDDVKSIEETCKFFSDTANTDYTKYGIKDCPGLCP